MLAPQDLVTWLDQGSQSKGWAAPYGSVYGALSNRTSIDDKNVLLGAVQYEYGSRQPQTATEHDTTMQWGAGFLILFNFD